MTKIIKSLRLGCIGNNTNNKAMQLKFKIEDWSIQGLKGLRYSMRDLEFDK